MPSTPDAESTVGFNGTSPSIESALLPTRESLLLGVGSVISASFPTRSLMVPPLSASAVVVLISRASMRSPANTTYLNESVDEPLPET